MKRLLPFLVALGLFLSFFTPTIASAAICASAPDSTAQEDGFGDAGTLTHFAGVQFTVASQCDVGAIKVRLAAAGGPVDAAAATLWTASGGLPLAQLGATSTFSGVPAFPSNAIVSTANANCLAAGTYYLVLGRTGALNSSADWAWYGAAANTLTKAKYNNSGWLANNSNGVDFSFEIDDGGSACGGGATPPKIQWNLIVFGFW